MENLTCESWRRFWDTCNICLASQTPGAQQSQVFLLKHESFLGGRTLISGVIPEGDVSIPEEVGTAGQRCFSWPSTAGVDREALRCAQYRKSGSAASHVLRIMPDP